MKNIECWKKIVGVLFFVALLNLTGCLFEESCAEFSDDKHVYVNPSLALDSLISNVYLQYDENDRRYESLEDNIAVDSVIVLALKGNDSLRFSFLVRNAQNIMILVDSSANLSCDTSGNYSSWHKSDVQNRSQGVLHGCGYYYYVDCP